MPFDIVGDGNNNFFVSDAFANQIIFLNSTSLQSSIFAGNGSAGNIDAGLTDSTFNYPTYMAYNQYIQTLYITDVYNRAIRIITGLFFYFLKIILFIF